jgi:hypothetical protein
MSGEHVAGGPKPPALTAGAVALGDDPTLVPRKAAFALLGIGATKGHELINTGQLDARKIGDKTVITMASIRRYVAGLPRVREAA